MIFDITLLVCIVLLFLKGMYIDVRLRRKYECPPDSRVFCIPVGVEVTQVELECARFKDGEPVDVLVVKNTGGFKSNSDN